MGQTVSALLSFLCVSSVFVLAVDTTFLCSLAQCSDCSGQYRVQVVELIMGRLMICGAHSRILISVSADVVARAVSVGAGFCCTRGGPS